MKAWMNKLGGVLLASLLTSLLKILQSRVDPMTRPRTVKGVEMHDPG